MRAVGGWHCQVLELATDTAYAFFLYGIGNRPLIRRLHARLWKSTSLGPVKSQLGTRVSGVCYLLYFRAGLAGTRGICW